MNRRLRLTLGIAAIGLAACARQTVILLPGAEGKQGAVSVRGERGEVVLDRPYEKAVTTGAYALEKGLSGPEEAARLAGRAMTALPPPPVQYLLYFEAGGAQLTAESEAALEKMLTDLRARPAPEITIVGHTDRTGSAQDNDRLSLSRAQAIRQALVSRGVPEGSLTAAGRGERDPPVPTADEVPEARNRRVEMILR